MSKRGKSVSLREIPGSAVTASEAAVSPLRTGSNAPADAAATLEQRIGREIRAMRVQIGLTGTELARAAGISPGMLSKIETGQISASLGTLDAVAGVLNVSVASILAGTEPRRDCSFVKAGGGLRIDRRGTKAGHRYDLLGHTVGGALAVEPYLISLAQDAVPYTAFQHAGVELIHMLIGRVQYRHGELLYDMEPGDTLFFDASARHGPETLTQLPATYLSFIAYSRA